MKKLTVQHGQTIMDIGIQEYGHITGAEQVVRNNPQYAITDVPVPGSIVMIDDVVPELSTYNRKVVNSYKAANITVASGAATNMGNVQQYVAEGYWINGYVKLI